MSKYLSGESSAILANQCSLGKRGMTRIRLWTKQYDIIEIRDVLYVNRSSHYKWKNSKKSEKEKNIG